MQEPGPVTPLQAAASIAERCPDWAVDSIAHLGDGDFCAAFLVNEAWVFRFAKHADAAASLRREWCLLPRIADQFDLRVPSPTLLNVDASPAFLVHPLLPGPILSKERYLQL